MAFAEIMTGVNGFLYFFALLAVVGILIVLSMMYNNKMCTLDAPNTYCSDMNSKRNQKIGKTALLRRMRGRRTSLSPGGGRFREGMEMDRRKRKLRLKIGKKCSKDQECQSGICAKQPQFDGSRCVTGEEAQVCYHQQDCKSGICVYISKDDKSICTDGKKNSPCNSTNQCNAGLSCENHKCT